MHRVWSGVFFFVIIVYFFTQQSLILDTYVLVLKITRFLICFSILSLVKEGATYRIHFWVMSIRLINIFYLCSWPWKILELIKIYAFSFWLRIIDDIRPYHIIVLVNFDPCIVQILVSICGNYCLRASICACAARQRSSNVYTVFTTFNRVIKVYLI